MDKAVQLSGNNVELIGLQESHIDELIELASDKRIWQFYTLDGSKPEKLRESLQAALADKLQGTQYAFVIKDKKQGKIIGSTRFLDIQPKHKKLEIGWTWLHPDYWGTGINLECKFLLLSYCFEELKTIRVQLKTDENNLRSRKAIEKIGASFEGILRNDMIRDNGTIRNSAYYSIIDADWPKIKKNLKLDLE